MDGLCDDGAQPGSLRCSPDATSSAFFAMAIDPPPRHRLRFTRLAGEAPSVKVALPSSDATGRIRQLPPHTCAPKRSRLILPATALRCDAQSTEDSP